MANITIDVDDPEAQDKAYSPEEVKKRETEAARHSAEAAGDIEGGLSPSEQAALDQMETGERERQGDDIVNNYTGQNEKKKFSWKALFKKQGPTGGVVVALFLGVFAGTGFFAQGTMLVGIMQNLTTTNDSASTSMEQRFVKIMQFATAGDNPLCESSSIKCRMGKISNSALRKLNTKGVVAIFDDGTAEGKRYDGKKTGYPDQKVKVYEIDLGDGVKRNVTADNMRGFMLSNPKFAAKVMGATGAFNFRARAWAGEHIFNRLYKPFNLDRKGGLADGKGLPKQNKLASLFEKLREKIPGNEKLSGGVDAVKSKINGQMGKAKKGGVVYLGLVAGCIGVKAPGFIAAAVAAVQLGQILPIVMNVALSPGSSAMASGGGSGFTSDDADTVGTLLTEKAPNEDGELKSALDSPLFLAAMGMGGKPQVSQKFTPGLSVLTNPFVMASNQAAKETEPACNAIMSPAAMYSAMAVDTATTIALSGTVVGGIVKVGVSFAISEITAKLVEVVAGQVATDVITQVASNDAIPKAQGQELGDILGIGASAFFSSGGMARNLPALTESQALAFNEITKENQEFHRQMDLASLSPFDISSQYTFLGSIVHNMRNAAILNSSSTSNLGSGIVSLLQSPLSLIFPQANAAGLEGDYCSYAKQFGLETYNEAGTLNQTPAINQAGLPCTGLTREQVNMSTAEAIDLMAPWLDESKSIKDDSTIEDLVKNGYIKADTPLSDFIADCGDASTGNYLFNSASCVFDGSPTGSINAAPGDASACPSDDDTCATQWDDFSPAANNVEARRLAAMPVFLLDYQIQKSFNGEDEVKSSKGGTPAGVTVDLAALYEDSSEIACAAGTNDVGVEDGYTGGNLVRVRLCELTNIDKINDPDEDARVRVNSRVSGAFKALTDKMRTDLGRAPIVSSFRSMAEQIRAKEIYGSRAADPGFSNHQMGLAIDFQLDTGNNDATKAPGSDAVYDWLVANAASFQVKQLDSESWHWEIVP